MAGAIGAGICVLLLPVADMAAGTWRILFALALLGLVPLRSIATALPETKRFRVAHPEVDLGGHSNRLWLLAVSALLLNVFFTPALQFTNEFLRDSRGFDGARIALFQTITTVPGAIGIIAGGRIADVRGRRIVATVALVGGVGTTVFQFMTHGWPLWAWSTMASIVGAATVPALGVYGPELFPTSLRGRANAVIGVVGRVGSVIGLVAVGVVSDRHGFGPALSLVAVGPALLAILVLAAYPETAHRSLEDINPEDA
jgi:MFS family permease